MNVGILIFFVLVALALAIAATIESADKKSGFTGRTMTGANGVDRTIGLQGPTGNPASVSNFVLAPIGTQPNADGASLVVSTLNLQPADGTNGGVLSNTTQNIVGAKTFLTSIAGPFNTLDNGTGSATFVNMMYEGVTIVTAASTTLNTNFAVVTDPAGTIILNPVAGSVVTVYNATNNSSVTVHGPILLNQGTNAFTNNLLIPAFTSFNLMFDPTIVAWFGLSNV